MRTLLMLTISLAPGVASAQSAQTPPQCDRLVSLSLPNVTITPHVSQQAETNQNFGVDVFCDNLARLLKGEELVNVVDWKRGY